LKRYCFVSNCVKLYWTVLTLSQHSWPWTVTFSKKWYHNHWYWYTSYKNWYDHFQDQDHLCFQSHPYLADSATTVGNMLRLKILYYNYRYCTTTSDIVLQLKILCYNDIHCTIKQMYYYWTLLELHTHYFPLHFHY